MSASEFIAPGATVGSYRIERQLGEGGMGSVWLATHTALGSQHALKFLDASLMASTKIRDRFVAEGRIQAQIAHPNVVRVTDIISEPGLAGLVMEYVEGPSLQAWIDDLQRPGTEDELRALFLPLVSAVGAVHERGIIHRDLKPGNVLVAPGMRPVLVDFGIARVAGDADIDHTPRSRTRTGVQLGTPGYMSPEQIRGEADLDQRADVFSLGAILYELVAGRGAFDAPSEFEVMRKVVDGEYAPASGIPGAIGRLDAVIARALAVDRDVRYPDCAALTAALTDALAAPPAVEHEPSGRSWIGPVLAAVAAFVLVVGGYLALRAPTPVATNTTPTPAASQQQAPQPTPAPAPTPTPSPTPTPTPTPPPTPDEPTPAVTPAPTPTPAPPPRGSKRGGPIHPTPSWIVTAGSYTSETDALTRVAELEALGFDAAHLWIPDYGTLSGDRRWSTFVGPAVNARDARRLIRELRRFQHDAGGLRLDTTGTREALSAVRAPKAPSRPVTTSFDCSKARTEVEILICSDSRLGALDVQTSKGYFAARDAVTGKARDSVVRAQRSFLAARDRCARRVDMRSCVAALQTARIKALDRRPRTLQRR